MRNIRSYLIILIASFAIAACGGRKSVDDEVSVESVGGLAGSDTGSDEASASGLSDDDSSDSSGLDSSLGGGGEGALLNRRVIYFEYDSSNLSLENEQIIQAHGQYLSTASGVGIILEGHADERGTREYNLALGEDRAKTVSNFLQALGVGSSRIQTISYGEERPVSLGSDEGAWNLNRRVEILYQ